MAEIALKHDAPVPKGLKPGAIVLLRGRVQVDPVKPDIYQIPQGSAIYGEVVARERDDLGHSRLKIKTEGTPGKAYFWIYNDKLYSHDPFEKPIIKGVTKRRVLNHYRTAWPILRKEIIGHNLTVVLAWPKGDKPTQESRLYPKNTKRAGQTFEIKSWRDLDMIVFYHGVEIVPDLELKTEYGMLRRGVIDVDSKASLEDTKHVVVLLYQRLLEVGRAARVGSKKVSFRPYIVSTGSKAGFHVRFDIMDAEGKKSVALPAMELKDLIDKGVLLYLWATSDIIKEHCLDPHRRMYGKVDPSIRAGKVFLDLSPMKARGGIKAIGSINAKTLAIVQRVPLNQLADFMPKPDAVE
jgi:hypothetical protein